MEEEELIFLHRNCADSEKTDQLYLMDHKSVENVIAISKFVLEYDKKSLPKLAKYVEWQEFIDAYNNTSKNYTDLENLARIYLSLERPATLILIYSNKSTDPRIVINTLEAHLGEPADINIYNQKCEDLPNFTNDIRYIPNIAKQIINIIDSIVGLNNKAYLNNDKTNNIILEKLTKELKYKYDVFYKNNENEKDEYEYIETSESKRLKIENLFDPDVLPNEINYFDDNFEPCLIKLKNFFLYVICVCERYKLILNMDKNEFDSNKICHKCKDNHGTEYCYVFHTTYYENDEQDPCELCLKEYKHPEPCNEERCAKNTCYRNHTFLRDPFTYIRRLKRDSVVKHVLFWRTDDAEVNKNCCLQILEGIIYYVVDDGENLINYDGSFDRWLTYIDQFYYDSSTYSTFQNIAKLIITVEGEAKNLLIDFLNNGIIKPNDIMQKFHEILDKPLLEHLIIKKLSEIPNLTDDLSNAQEEILKRNITEVFGCLLATDIKIGKRLNANENIIQCVINKLSPRVLVTWNEYNQMEGSDLNSLVEFLRI